MKKYASILLVSVLVLGLGGGYAQAEEASMTVEAEAETPAVKGVPVKVRLDAVKAKTDARVEIIEAKGEVRAEKSEAMKAKIETRAEITAEMKAKLKARTDAIKKEKKAKLDEAKRTRVETAARVSIRVLTDALNRVQDLASRADGFAAKLEARGVSVVEVRAKLTEAGTVWTAAQVKVAGLEADLAAAVASETPMGAFETFRTHAGEAREGIKAAHALVVEAIASLRASVPAPAAAASATVETSATVEAAQ